MGRSALVGSNPTEDMIIGEATGGPPGSVLTSDTWGPPLCIIRFGSETFCMTDTTDIEARLDEIERHGAFKYYRPLENAANEFISWAENPQNRIYTGVRVFDEAMRGTAPGELTVIQGFTHSGKTLFATEILINNPHVPFTLYTPDETRPLVLTKLTTAVNGVSARELEQRIQKDDEEARQLLIKTARAYSKLAIFDESVTLIEMSRMYDEVTDAMGEPPKAFMFDYAKLLKGYDDVDAAITALKSWGKDHNLPGFVLHQASRTSGSHGRKMEIDSGAYGGEQQATHVIGVRRKKYQHIAAINALEEKLANTTNHNQEALYEAKIREIRDILLPMDEDTITVSLVKNKRPPCDLIDDQDFKIDTRTGRMTAVRPVTLDNGGVVRVSKASLNYIHSEGKPWTEQELL